MDICANRHGGNAESVAANKRVTPTKAELRISIYDYIASRGAEGATTEEVSIALGIRYTTASARISELEADRWVRKAGRRPTSGGSTAAVLQALSRVNRSQVRTRRYAPRVPQPPATQLSLGLRGAA